MKELVETLERSPDWMLFEAAHSDEAERVIALLEALDAYAAAFYRGGLESGSIMHRIATRDALLALVEAVK